MGDQVELPAELLAHQEQIEVGTARPGALLQKKHAQAQPAERLLPPLVLQDYCRKRILGVCRAFAQHAAPQLSSEAVDALVAKLLPDGRKEAAAGDAAAPSSGLPELSLAFKHDCL